MNIQMEETELKHIAEHSGDNFRTGESLMFGNRDWNDDAENMIVCINSEGCMQL